MRPDGEIDSSYSSGRFGSKYNDDDGGPSLWWKDKLVKRISENSFKNTLSSDTIRGIQTQISSIHHSDDDALDRFERILENGNFKNALEFQSTFSKSESFRGKSYKAWRTFSLWAMPANIMMILSEARNFANRTEDITSWIGVFALFITIPLFIHYFFSNEKKYYPNLLSQTDESE